MNNHTWMGTHPILHPDHERDLELASAVNEFSRKIPRDQAELDAHGAYVKKHREAAAAHHLRGVRAARASGDAESAKKHHAMYDLHLKALGHDPVGEPPPEVERLAKQPADEVHKFRPHPGDAFAVADRPAPTEAKPEEAKKSIRDRLDVLCKAAKAYLLTQK